MFYKHTHTYTKRERCNNHCHNFIVMNISRIKTTSTVKMLFLFGSSASWFAIRHIIHGNCNSHKLYLLLQYVFQTIDAAANAHAYVSPTQHSLADYVALHLFQLIQVLFFHLFSFFIFKKFCFFHQTFCRVRHFGCWQCHRDTTLSPVTSPSLLSLLSIT